MKLISLLFILTLLLYALTAPHVAQGQITVSGDFLSGPTGSEPTSTDAAFWTGGGDADADPATTPNTDGVVGVTSDGLLTITGGSDLNLHYLDLGRNTGVTGTVDISGAGSTLNLANDFHIGAEGSAVFGSEDIGSGGNGVVNISSGAVVTSAVDIWLGDSATSSGTVTVDGAGSILRASDDIFVGDDGIGSLTIRNGGLVEIADVFNLGDDPTGSGTVLVDGINSILRGRDFFLGDGGTGQVTVSNGGLLYATDDIVIADDVGGISTGSLTVQGANSRVTVADLLNVGDDGKGTLNVTGGSNVQASRIIVGSDEGSEGSLTVDGTGSSVVATDGSANVGRRGKGTAVVSNGGRLEGAVIRLGDFATGDGQITVQGANSTIISSDNYLVGHSGTGNLIVSDGARAEVGHFVFVGLNPGAVGQVTVQGTGTTLETITGGITLSEGGRASLNILDGAQVTTFADTTIGNGASGSGEVTVSGNNSRLSSANIIVGGSGPGELNVLNGGQATASNYITVGESASGGIVSVRGTGSTVSASSLNLGDTGASSFNISESGSASFTTATVNAASTVNLVVSGNSMLTATTSFTNNGTVNFIAGQQTAAGSYMPISSASFLGAGSYVGIGGTTSLPSGVPTFTVSAIKTDTGNDGTESGINGGDRVQFGDVMVALNENAGTNGSLTVTDLNLSTVSGYGALGAYSFAATGLNTSLSIALSLYIGTPIEPTFGVYQRTTGAGDNAWVSYTPGIIDYTNGWYTFTVNELNGFDYAVVPEPRLAALLAGLLGLGFVLWQRKCRRCS